MFNMQELAHFYKSIVHDLYKITNNLRTVPNESNDISQNVTLNNQPLSE